MRIAMISTSYPLHAASASGPFVRRLVQSLPPELQVTVITPCDNTTVATGNGDRGQLRCFRYAPRRWQLLAHQPGGMPAAIAQNRLLLLLLPVFALALFVACLRASRHAELLHANWSISGLVAGLAGLLMRRPVVTTLRGTDVTRADTSLLFRATVYFCLLLNRRVLTVSRAMCRALQARYPRHAHKIAFLPNGVEPALLEIPRPRTVAAPLPARVLCAGNLVPNKGVDLLLQALAALPPELPVVADIVGGGAQLAALRAQAAALGLGERVHFHGSVPQARMTEFYRAADILVLASYSEGRPNVVLEAMGAGVAVIATSISGVQELIGHERTGLLFAPGDHAALSACLQRLLTQPELRRQLAENARRTIVEENLLWPQTGACYARVYAEVLEAGAGAG